MPTKQELRLWLRGKRIEGLPDTRAVWDHGGESEPTPTISVDMAVCEDCRGTGLKTIQYTTHVCETCNGKGHVRHKEPEKPEQLEMNLGDTMRAKHWRNMGKVKVRGDNGDMELCFGIHRGMKLTDLVKTAEGRDYMKWLDKTFSSGGDLDKRIAYVCSQLLAEWRKQR